MIDFVIIGAAKSGTTAARINLDRHPKIHVGHELHFFDLRWHQYEDKSEYFEMLPKGEGLKGEKSPSYISFLPAHERMRGLIPDVKLILFLRDPIDRAFSHWNHITNSRFAPLVPNTFEETITQAITGLEDIDKHYNVPEGSLFGTPIFQNVIYRGLYCDQIEHLLRFYPRQQLHIAITERVKANMKEEYDRIFRFLGLEAVQVDLGYHRNGRYESEISPKTQSVLRDFYLPHNERLFDLLGEDIPEWNTHSSITESLNGQETENS